MDDDEQRLYLIGLVAVTSAGIENLLASLAGELVGSRRAMTLITGQGFSTLKSYITTMVDLPEYAPFRTEAREMLARVSAAYEKRNTVVHGVWSQLTVDPPSHQVVRPRRLKPEGQTSEWTVEALRELVGELESCEVQIAIMWANLMIHIDHHSGGGPEPAG